MALFTITCAFHETDRLLERTLPRAIDALTRPTRHDVEVILVADRSREDVISRLVPRIADLGVDELRIRRPGALDFSGAPSNNFHGHHFVTTSPYLITFTDDTFIWKEDPGFDVLDAIATAFRRHPRLTLISKVDDHDEWDHPLIDVGPELEPGLRSVNRVVDQLIAYDTARFAAAATAAGAWRRDAYGVRDGTEWQWENLASEVGTTGGRQIGYPGRWPLRVRHSDLRHQPGSMHGTQDEDVKLTVFDQLLRTGALAKVAPP